MKRSYIFIAVGCLIWTIAERTKDQPSSALVSFICRSHARTPAYSRHARTYS